MHVRQSNRLDHALAPLQLWLLLLRALQYLQHLILLVNLLPDTPDIHGGNAVEVGAGPVVGTYTFHGRGTLNGLIPHPRLLALVEEAADAQKVDLQRHATIGLLTDASYVQLVGEGIACVDVAWPTRYTHSGVEVCSLDDLEDLTKLLIGVVKKFPTDENFSRG